MRVNIWMWKSERQADLEPAFQDLEKQSTRTSGIDSYPNLTALSARAAHAQRPDPRVRSHVRHRRGGPGNIVSDPTRGARSKT